MILRARDLFALANMQQYITLPDGSRFEQLPGETIEQAVKAAAQKYPEAFGIQQQHGFMGALKQGAAQGVGAAAQGIGALANMPGVEQWGEKYATPSTEPGAYHDTTSAEQSAAYEKGIMPGLSSSIDKYLTEYIGNIAGRYGAPLAAGIAAGAYAPELLGGAALADVVGFTAVNALPATGENIAEQRAQQKLNPSYEMNNVNAVMGGLAESALMSGLGRLGGRAAQGVLEALGPDLAALSQQVVRGEITQAEAAAQLTSKATNIAVRTGEAAGVGVPMMAGTEAIKMAQAGEDLSSPEAVDRMQKAAVGALAFAPLGAFGGALGKRYGTADIQKAGAKNLENLEQLQQTKEARDASESAGEQEQVTQQQDLADRIPSAVEDVEYAPSDAATRVADQNRQIAEQEAAVQEARKPKDFGAKLDTRQVEQLMLAIPEMAGKAKLQSWVGKVINPIKTTLSDIPQLRTAAEKEGNVEHRGVKLGILDLAERRLAKLNADQKTLNDRAAEQKILEQDVTNKQYMAENRSRKAADIEAVAGQNRVAERTKYLEDTAGRNTDMQFDAGTYDMFSGKPTRPKAPAKETVEAPIRGTPEALAKLHTDTMTAIARAERPNATAADIAARDELIKQARLNQGKQLDITERMQDGEHPQEQLPERRPEPDNTGAGAGDDLPIQQPKRGRVAKPVEAAEPVGSGVEPSEPAPREPATREEPRERPLKTEKQVEAEWERARGGDEDFHAYADLNPGGKEAIHKIINEKPKGKELTGKDFRAVHEAHTDWNYAQRHGIGVGRVTDARAEEKVARREAVKHAKREITPGDKIKIKQQNADGKIVTKKVDAESALTEASRASEAMEAAVTCLMNFGSKTK